MIFLKKGEKAEEPALKNPETVNAPANTTSATTTTANTVSTSADNASKAAGDEKPAEKKQEADSEL